MTLDEYKDEVIKEARRMVSEPFLGMCMCSISTSFSNNLSVEEAAEIVLEDTAYWDNN